MLNRFSKFVYIANYYVGINRGICFCQPGFCR